MDKCIECGSVETESLDEHGNRKRVRDEPPNGMTIRYVLDPDNVPRCCVCKHELKK